MNESYKALYVCLLNRESVPQLRSLITDTYYVAGNRFGVWDPEFKHFYLVNREFVLSVLNSEVE